MSRWRGGLCIWWCLTGSAARCSRGASRLRERRGRVERCPRSVYPPEIMNTDQSSQFTSVAFSTALQEAQIVMSMDGQGASRDHVVVERL